MAVRGAAAKSGLFKNRHPKGQCITISSEGNPKAYRAGIPRQSPIAAKSGLFKDQPP